MITDERW
jgi:hypothetical protein